MVILNQTDRFVSAIETREVAGPYPTLAKIAFNDGTVLYLENVTIHDHESLPFGVVYSREIDESVYNARKI